MLKTNSGQALMDAREQTWKFELNVTCMLALIMVAQTNEEFAYMLKRKRLQVAERVYKAAFWECLRARGYVDVVENGRWITPAIDDLELARMVKYGPATKH